MDTLTAPLQRLLIDLRDLPSGAKTHDTRRLGVDLLENLPLEMTPYILGYWLEHLRLESEARKQRDKNGFVVDATFHTLVQTRLRENLQDNLRDNRQDGREIPVERLEHRTLQVVLDVYHLPRGMFIDYYLYHSAPALNPSQWVALDEQMSVAHTICADPDAYLGPAFPLLRGLRHALLSLYFSRALFLDWLFAGKTQWADTLRRLESIDERVQAAGAAIFTNVWHTIEGYRNEYVPGDEYDMVEEIGILLGATTWYDWQVPGPNCRIPDEQIEDYDEEEDEDETEYVTMGVPTASGA